MKKRIFVLFLAGAMLLSSCGKSDVQHEHDPAADFTEKDGEIFSDVPGGDYGGFVYKVLNAEGTSPASRFDADEITGDTVNDVVYHRNANVESRLNVNIEEEIDSAENVGKKAMSAAQSGDASYSLISAPASELAALALGGYITDMGETAINTEKPWWNKSLSESATVGGKLFFLFGDIQPSVCDAHSMIGFNMNIVNDVDGIINPYKIVDSGNWTLETMFEMSKAAFSDLDGNSVYNTEDRYGIATDNSEMPKLLFGGGVRYSETESGVPVMTCPTDEDFYNLVSLIHSELYSNRTGVYDSIKNKADGITPGAMFKGGRSLFFVTTVGHLYSMRDVDFEFGVLPLPKADAEQKNYVSYISAVDAAAVSMPITCRDVKRFSVITENLCAESHREGGLYEHYVDSVLQFRYISDEESRKNLNMILSSGIIDPADVFNWGSIRNTVEKLTKNIAGYPTEMAKVRKTALDDIINTLDRLED